MASATYREGVLGIVGTRFTLLPIQALRRRDPRASEGCLGAYVEYLRQIRDQSASEVSPEGKVIRLPVLIFTADVQPLATLLSKRLFSAVPDFTESGHSVRRIHLETFTAFGWSASDLNAPAWNYIASLEVSICGTAQVTL